MPASDKKQKINHFVVIGLIELIFISAWSYLMFFSPESLRLNNVLEINVDAYVRLEKIYQWLDGGGWFFKILSRVGVEDHLVLHWTRPLDVLIAPLALLLKPFYGLHDAVYIAGPMMSLPVGIIFYAMASRLALICGQRRYDSMQFSAIFVLLVPHFLFVLTHRNWPDHHGLLLLLFLASLLLASRMIEGGKHAIWMLGLVLALGVWVSVEAMFALLSINIGLGLLWVTGLVKNTAKTSLLASLATLGGIAFSLLAEFATLFPGMALDRISTFSLLGAGAISFIWLVAYIGDRRFAHPFVRALIGAISAIVAGTLLFIIRPEVIHGPMADADKWFVEVWGGIYGDGFYLVALGVNFIIAGGIISSVWLGTKDKKSLIAGILFMPAMLIYAGFFNANSERWAVYAEIIAIIFIIPAFFRIYDYLKSKPGIVSSVFPAIGVVVLFSLAGADTVLGQMHAEKLSSSNVRINADGKREKICYSGTAIKQLNKTFSDRNIVVMAHPNTTPAILFHSHFRVFSVPIHPDGAAVHETYNALRTTAEHFPPATGADILMICPGGVDQATYGKNPDSLHARLAAGQAVAGLKQVAGDFGGYQVYKIIDN